MNSSLATMCSYKSPVPTASSWLSDGAHEHQQPQQEQQPNKCKDTQIYYIDLFKKWIEHFSLPSMLAKPSTLTCQGTLDLTEH